MSFISNIYYRGITEEGSQTIEGNHKQDLWSYDFAIWRQLVMTLI
jgi:hypothetical protein